VWSFNRALHRTKENYDPGAMFMYFAKKKIRSTLEFKFVTAYYFLCHHAKDR